MSVTPSFLGILKNKSRKYPPRNETETEKTNNVIWTHFIQEMDAPEIVSIPTGWYNKEKEDLEILK